MMSVRYLKLSTVSAAAILLLNISIVVVESKSSLRLTKGGKRQGKNSVGAPQLQQHAVIASRGVVSHESKLAYLGEMHDMNMAFPLYSPSTSQSLMRNSEVSAHLALVALCLKPLLRLFNSNAEHDLAEVVVSDRDGRRGWSRLRGGALSVPSLVGSIMTSYAACLVANPLATKVSVINCSNIYISKIM